MHTNTVCNMNLKDTKQWHNTGGANRATALGKNQRGRGGEKKPAVVGSCALSAATSSHCCLCALSSLLCPYSANNMLEMEKE